MGLKPLMLAHNNPETKLRVKRKHHRRGFIFDTAPVHSLPRRISDLPLELHGPHLDGC